MRKLGVVIVVLLFPILAQNYTVRYWVKPELNTKPTISFTFDDGKTTDLGGYKLADWHGRILAALRKHQLKAILFVAGHNKKSVNGKYVLSTWVEAGHYLANHTLNHPNFNSKEVTLEQFKQELLANDALLKTYPNYLKLFRFPYLKEGNTVEKVEGFRAFLKQQGFKHGHVTIDDVDWYIDSRLRNRLTQQPNADLAPYRTFYIAHLYHRAMFYDSLAMVLTGRHISHSMLLHHNLVSGLFLDDLISYFKQQGWKVIDAHKAFNDNVYETVTHTQPAGESLTWSMAKESGKFESVLHYPAESEVYEKDTMDKLGL